MLTYATGIISVDLMVLRHIFFANSIFFFCGFPGYKPVPPCWFKIVCWFYAGNTQGLTECGFMEKPGTEPATPGLQGIALIHYTTANSISHLLNVAICPCCVATFWFKDSVLR